MIIHVNSLNFHICSRPIYNIFFPIEPDVEQINKRAGKEINKFAELIFQHGSGTPFASSGKIAVSVATPTLKELEKYLDTGTLSKLTVPVLKQCVSMLRVKPVSNKKADLLKAIAKHFHS